MSVGDDDPYEVLGLPRFTSTAAQVKARQRALLAKVHPDVAQDVDSDVRAELNREAAKINAAADMLLKDRANVDRRLRELERIEGERSARATPIPRPTGLETDVAVPPYPPADSEPAHDRHAASGLPGYLRRIVVFHIGWTVLVTPILFLLSWGAAAVAWIASVGTIQGPGAFIALAVPLFPLLDPNGFARNLVLLAPVTVATGVIAWRRRDKTPSRIQIAFAALVVWCVATVYFTAIFGRTVGILGSVPLTGIVGLLCGSLLPLPPFVRATAAAPR
jgi:hypothetical protein